MQNIFSSMMAAMGRQLKHSVKVFHSLTLYRRLPSSMKRRDYGDDGATESEREREE